MGFSTTIFSLLLIIYGTACVPKKQCLSKLTELQTQCDQASQQYDELIKKLEADLKLKNERLSKFNQINQDGTLRDNTWKGDVTKPVKGNEPWLK